MTLHQMSQTMTTAAIVRHFRERGELDALMSQLDTLPKGEQLAIESCVAGKVGVNNEPVRLQDECQDIANDLLGA